MPPCTNKTYMFSIRSLSMNCNRGFIWIAQNNSTTDYVELSINLAKSIKRLCKENNIAIVVDKGTKVPLDLFDRVIPLEQDESKDIEWKLNNEYKVFDLSPWTHTIKLEADMLFTTSTDWWWNQLQQYNMVFSYHCRDYKDNVVKQSPYRKIFSKNYLPDVYSGLTYFRRSKFAMNHFVLCKAITKNWKYVKENILIDCHDENPTTDVVYALANKIMDPLQLDAVKLEWFNFVHNKYLLNVNTARYSDDSNYLYPQLIDHNVYIGGYKTDRIWHYHKKDLLKEINERVL